MTKRFVGILVNNHSQSTRKQEEASTITHINTMTTTSVCVDGVCQAANSSDGLQALSVRPEVLLIRLSIDWLRRHRAIIARCI